MKKIANLTQTYGNLRYQEIKHFLSEQNIKILNKLDVITFSFHCCPDDFKQINTKKILEKLPNCIIYYFDNIGYVESIIKYLHNLKELGVTDYIMWQDDHYMNEHPKTEELFSILLNYYKNNSINYISLFFNTFYEFQSIRYNTVNIINNLNVYEFDTYDIKQYQDSTWFGAFPYSDENYIMDINLALKYFFIEEYKDLNIWELELKLGEKSSNLHIKRWFSNAILFYRRSIHSMGDYPPDVYVAMKVEAQKNKDIENINNTLL